MSTSALNQQFWRQFLGIQLDISIAIAILRKGFHIIYAARIGQWRKGKKAYRLPQEPFLGSASTGMKYPEIQHSGQVECHGGWQREVGSVISMLCF